MPLVMGSPTGMKPELSKERLRVGEVYAVRCPDSTHYYRTVMLKRNDLSGKFQVFISNPVYGDTPPGMEVSQGSSMAW